jgi:hypothetical protein
MSSRRPIRKRPLLEDDLDEVTLRGGLTVPLAALTLSLDLERRGIALSRTEDGTLRVDPADRITPADELAIARWRGALEALVAYVDTLESLSH